MMLTKLMPVYKQMCAFRALICLLTSKTGIHWTGGVGNYLFFLILGRLVMLLNHYPAREVLILS